MVQNAAYDYSLWQTKRQKLFALGIVEATGFDSRRVLSLLSLFLLLWINFCKLDEKVLDEKVTF